MKLFLSIFTSFLLYSTITIAHGTIYIEGVEHEKGFIDVKIYNSKENFLVEELAIESIRKKPTIGKTLIPLSKIHEGEIAIVVYHDENNDNKLNTGLFWIPKEGYAFSNNYTPKGPPSFKKSKVQLIHGKPIYIVLKY